MEIIPSCTCTGLQSQSTRNPCPLCGFHPNPNPYPNPNIPLTFLFPFLEFEDSNSSSRVLDGVPRFITTAISGALTGFFALAGAFTGAITGALAGRAADCGVLRGAGLGAIAGAVLSVEVLEASRAYWCLEQSGSRGPSSMADFIEQLFRGRLTDDEIAPAILSAYNWQVSFTNGNLNENLDVYGEVASRGLSGDSLKKLPCHTLDQIKATQPICCTICLQDIEIGEMARSLPLCKHTFHLTCVDKWLVRHGSCPVCRQAV